MCQLRVYPRPYINNLIISFIIGYQTHIIIIPNGINFLLGFNNQIIWNGLDNAGRRVSSGVYFYRLEAGDFHATRKLVVMK